MSRTLVAVDLFLNPELKLRVFRVRRAEITSREVVDDSSFRFTGRAGSFQVPVMASQLAIAMDGGIHRDRRKYLGAASR